MTLGLYILDPDHIPVLVPDSEVLRWARWRSEHSCRVDWTSVGKVDVSTVFLGVDHRFGMNGPPLLFETMVFGGPLDMNQRRWSTWDDAVIGHHKIVGDIRAARDGVAKLLQQDDT